MSDRIIGLLTRTFHSRCYPHECNAQSILSAQPYAHIGKDKVCSQSRIGLRRSEIQLVGRRDEGAIEHTSMLRSFWVGSIVN